MELYRGLESLGALEHLPIWAENWIFATFGARADCRGRRMTRWHWRGGGSFKTAVDHPLAHEFAFKRVPRSAEIQHGFYGTETDGKRHPHSRAVNPARARAVRDFYLNLTSAPVQPDCAAAATAGAEAPAQLPLRGGNR